jgi:hypothetical protein
VTLFFYLLTIKSVVAKSRAFSIAWGSPPRTQGLWLLLAVAFPAVFVNLIHGQNGFLTASLIGGALVLLDRQSLLSGILFGLLAYKPQFGLLVPIALLVGGYWRALGAAVVTVCVLLAVTLLAFGTGPWEAYAASAQFARVVLLEMGEGGLPRIQSVFSWTLMWGGGISLAYAVQGALSLGVAFLVIRIWQGNQTYSIKAAALILGSLLATPYILDYDLVVLAPAIAFLACDGLARGFVEYEKSALAFLWFAPFFTRSVAKVIHVPLAVIAMLLMFMLIARRNQIKPLLGDVSEAAP